MTKRLAPIATILALALLAAPAVAGSTSKVKSGTYTGTLAAHAHLVHVTLVVSKRKLTKAHLNNFPIYCSGGGPAIPIKFPGVKIAPNTGAFTTDGEYVIKEGPLRGKVGDRFVLSGKFTSRGSVSGTLKTIDLNVKTCGGSSAFSART
jgi:hypothetical protein